MTPFETMLNFGTMLNDLSQAMRFLHESTMAARPAIGGRRWRFPTRLSSAGLERPIRVSLVGAFPRSVWGRDHDQQHAPRFPRWRRNCSSFRLFCHGTGSRRTSLCRGRSHSQERQDHHGRFRIHDRAGNRDRRRSHPGGRAGCRNGASYWTGDAGRRPAGQDCHAGYHRWPRPCRSRGVAQRISLARARALDRRYQGQDRGPRAQQAAGRLDRHHADR